MNWLLDGMRRLIKQQDFTELELCQKELEKYKVGKIKNKIYQIYRTHTKKENNSQTSENEYAVLQIFKYLYLLSVVFIVFS